MKMFQKTFYILNVWTDVVSPMTFNDSNEQFQFLTIIWNRGFKRAIDYITTCPALPPPVRICRGEPEVVNWCLWICIFFLNNVFELCNFLKFMFHRQRVRIVPGGVVPAWNVGMYFIRNIMAMIIVHHKKIMATMMIAQWTMSIIKR